MISTVIYPRVSVYLTNISPLNLESKMVKKFPFATTNVGNQEDIIFYSNSTNVGNQEVIIFYSKTKYAVWHNPNFMEDPHDNDGSTALQFERAVSQNCYELLRV